MVVVPASSVLAQIWEEKLATESPKLIANHRNQHDYHDDCKNRGGVTTPLGNGNQVTEPSFRVDDFGQDDPAPPHSVHSAQVIPYVRLGDRKQDMPHQLPLGR